MISLMIRPGIMNLDERLSHAKEGNGTLSNLMQSMNYARDLQVRMDCERIRMIVDGAEVKVLP